MQRHSAITQHNHHVFSFDAIGTSWRIAFDSDIHNLVSIKRRVLRTIEIFDSQYSRFRDNSLVQVISKGAGYYVLPDTAKPLLLFYKKLYEITGGAVTPLIGNLLSDAGYDKDYSLVASMLHDVPMWEKTLDYRHPVLRTHIPVLFDFGAAGKGYLVDIIAALFNDLEIGAYVVNAGGDIYCKGVLQVALERPDNTNEAAGTATITNQSICGSAGNRRTWGDFTHIMNPYTKQSQVSLAATWVVADSTMIADGLSTALFFTDAHTLKRHFEFEYAVIDVKGRLYCSDKFPATFFINQARVV